ncbi:MAG: hypothetical protein IJK89_07410 [Clostridia bacterium]|nr:hypothetical protein [Clostridia bacterium]
MRNKKGAAPENAEKLFSGTWAGVTAGVAVPAAAVTIPLVSVYGLKNIIAAFPQLFTDPEHDFLFRNGSIIAPECMKQFFRAFPPPLLIAFAVLIAAAFFMKKSAARHLIGALTSIVTVITIVYSFAGHFSSPYKTSYFIFTYRFFPLIPAAAVYFILTQKKERRLFGAYIAGIVSSLLVDVCSYLSLAMFEAVTVIPAVLMAGAFFAELKQEKSACSTNKKCQKKKSRSASAAFLCLALLFITVPMAEVACQYVDLTFYLVVNSVEHISELDVKLEEGPYKGMRLSKITSSNYALISADMHYIAENTDAPVYVASRFCLCYLFPGIDCAAYSTWYVNGTVDRQVNYWQTHPEKVPEYIYVPLVVPYLWEKVEAPEEEIVEDLRALEEYFTFTKTEGEAGWILKVTDCRIPQKGASR